MFAGRSDAKGYLPKYVGLSGVFGFEAIEGFDGSPAAGILLAIAPIDCFFE